MKTAARMEQCQTWLTGDSGANRTVWLAEQLFAKMQSEAEAATGNRYLRYSPWMSFREEREGLKPFFGCSVSQISTDKALLRALRKIFWIKPRRPLGRTSVTFPWISIDTQCESKDLDLYREAVDLVATSSPAWMQRVAVLASTIVPLKTLSPRARPGGVGFTTQFLKGAIFLSQPKLGDLSPIELAINLSHEIGHQALNIYLASDRIIAGDIDAPVYSAIRKTDRPAVLSFHAMVALAFMVDFSRNRLATDGQLGGVERNYLGEQLNLFEQGLKVATDTFGSVALTDLGREMLTEFKNLNAKRAGR